MTKYYSMPLQLRLKIYLVLKITRTIICIHYPKNYFHITKSGLLICLQDFTKKYHFYAVNDLL